MRRVIKPEQYENNRNGFGHSDNSGNKGDNRTQPPQLTVNLAFDKAQRIIDAANIYSENHIKEETQRMNQEAAKMRKSSREEGHAEGIASGRIEGREIGYKEGYKLGVKEALKINQAMIDKLTSILESLENAREDVITSQKNEMTELAISIAEMILNTKLQNDPTQISSIMDHIIEVYQNQNWIDIYVSRGLLGEMEKSDLKILEQIKSSSKGIRVLPGKDLSDTDCIVELPKEIIDASVSTQLDKIKAALRR